MKISYFRDFRHCLRISPGKLSSIIHVLTFYNFTILILQINYMSKIRSINRGVKRATNAENNLDGIKGNFSRNFDIHAICCKTAEVCA